MHSFTLLNRILFDYRCEIAAGNPIDVEDGIDTSGFHIEMGTAQFGAWASWACWVGLTVFAVLKMWRYHQLENLRVSMFLERQRLIRNNGGTSASSTLQSNNYSTDNSIEPCPSTSTQHTNGINIKQPPTHHETDDVMLRV